MTIRDEHVVFTVHIDEDTGWLPFNAPDSPELRSLLDITTRAGVTTPPRPYFSFHLTNFDDSTVAECGICFKTFAVPSGVVLRIIRSDDVACLPCGKLFDPLLATALALAESTGEPILPEELRKPALSEQKEACDDAT